MVSSEGNVRLRALFRREGEVVGTVETTFDGATALPKESIVLFPSSGALFLMTFQEIETLTSVDPTIWQEP